MQKIDELATTKKLALTDEEKTFIEEKVNFLEKSFDILGQINTDNIEPLVSVLDVQNVLREDITVKMLTRDELLNNAPEQYDGYFQVPKTID